MELIIIIIIIRFVKRQNVKRPEVSERLTISVIVLTRTDAHSLRSQVGMGSESDCLLQQLERILWISDSEAGLKVEKSGGVVEGEGECGDDVVWLLSKDRQSLDILSMNKEERTEVHSLALFQRFMIKNKAI